MCEHDLSDQDTAIADGICPLCLRATLVASQAEIEHEKQARIYAEKLLMQEPCTISEHEKLQEECEELRKALKKYSAHRYKCGFIHGNPCDCGLLKMLKSIEVEQSLGEEGK